MGFYLITIPLFLVTLGLFLYFIFTRNLVALYLIGGLWTTFILFIIIISVVGGTTYPIKLTKEQIIGEYHIDRTLYPGKNSNWQYDHFKFKITQQDSIYFYVTNNNGVTKEFKSQLKYSLGPPILWTLKDSCNFHTLKYSPVLFRGHKKYYYMFRSDKYGNMFFRKDN